MANQISAEAGALKKGADAVREAKTGIDSQIGNVRGQIEQLSGYWTGSAATAFTSLMQRWNEETAKLNNVLVNLEDSLRATERDEAATEEQHQSVIKNLGSMLG